MNHARLVAGLAVALAVGCSGNDKNEAPPPDLQDAAPDAELPHDAATIDSSEVLDLDACMREKVWTASSTGLTLHEDAGPPSAPSGDAGCSEGGVTFVFSLSAKTLTERKCKDHAVVEIGLVLPAVPADLVALLTPLQTSCAPGCGTGLPDLHLVVQDGAAANRTFDSSAYASCVDSSATNPIIRFADLRSLRLKLGDLLAVCDSEGGAAAPEAGSCTSTEGDAGAK
jgi:hypothetical protein